MAMAAAVAAAQTHDTIATSEGGFARVARAPVRARALDGSSDY